MGTRATYCFSNEGYKTTVYVHWDGYPSGAAEYFNHVLNFKGAGCFATKFIKAIYAAELTESHDYHGDTEYMYDLDLVTNILTALKINRFWGEDKEPEKQVVFQGKLLDFIKQNNIHPLTMKHHDYRENNAGLIGSNP